MLSDRGINYIYIVQFPHLINDNSLNDMAACAWYHEFIVISGTRTFRDIRYYCEQSLSLVR